MAEKTDVTIITNEFEIGDFLMVNSAVSQTITDKNASCFEFDKVEEYLCKFQMVNG